MRMISLSEAGLPRTAGRRRALVATVIDTLGAGAFIPLGFLFFTLVTDVPVVQVGFAISAATVVSLALMPIAGTLTDRFGARRMVIASNVLVAAGYSLYPLAHSAAGIFAGVLVVMAADRLYWAAWPAFVSEIADEGELDSWFSLVHALKSGSIGLGALVAAAALNLIGPPGLYLLLYFDVATSVVAAVLLWQRPSPRAAIRGPDLVNGRVLPPGATGSWRTVLRDRRFLALVVAQSLISSAWLIPAIALPVFLGHTLGLPVWLPLAIFGLNSAAVFLLQTTITRLVRHRRRVHVVIGAAVLLEVSIVIFAVLVYLPRPMAIVLTFVAISVFTVGEMLCLPTSNALAADLAPAEARGRYLSLFQLTFVLVWGLGPGVVGALLDSSGLRLWGVLAGLVAAGAVGYALIGRSRDPHVSAKPVTSQSAEAVAVGLVNQVVLRYDPAVPTLSPNYWAESVGLYQAVTVRLRARLASDAAATSAYERLVDSPGDRAAYEALRQSLVAAGVDDAELLRLLAESERHGQIGYQAGAADPVRVPEIDADRLISLAGKVYSDRIDRPRRGDGDIAVIIPFRDPTGGQRTRNLVASLLALRDQTLDPDRLQVTVVEADEHPNWQRPIELLADHYIHAPSAGLFNKSWAVNVGVAHTRATPRVICVLDADILIDRDFLDRNARRMALRHTAHLPHRDALELDAPSASLAIHVRCEQRKAAIDTASLRGYLMRMAPGGCVWTSIGAFERIGGFDERYEGWGGEDDDFIDRLAQLGTVRRYGEVLLHLYHPRPTMDRDGKPINAHIPARSWRPTDGIGRLDRFATSYGRRQAERKSDA